MIINGKEIAGEIVKEAREAVDSLGREPVVRAVTVQPTPVTGSYLKIKSVKAAEAGMLLDIVQLSEEATEEEVIAAVQQPGADAVIVQLPLPAHMDTQRVLDTIPLEQDADVLSSEAHQRFHIGDSESLLPPVTAAIAQILERTNVTVAGKRAVVVGNGKLVGKPAARWLTRQGALVTVLNEENFAKEQNALKEADIIISGAGSGHFIKPNMITSGAVCIDAGTSELKGSIAGDFDPTCAEIASVFTPVPGGVGPIAVACLFKNVGMLLTESGLQTH